ncbi:MAG: hypothetical protein WAO36_03590 [Candidatus Methanoculleus thermohydrogenotrophicum]|jgi:hypothetical protein|nr:hypothetical protein [Candidatus Methanoculleus thermohydrogenotrophicum]
MSRSAAGVSPACRPGSARSAPAIDDPDDMVVLLLPGLVLWMGDSAHIMQNRDGAGPNRAW